MSTRTSGSGGSGGLLHKVWHAFDGLAVDTLWSAAHDGTQLIAAFSQFQMMQSVLLPPVYGAYFGLYGLLGAFGAMTYSGVGLALLQRILGERDDPEETLRSFLSLSLLAGLVSIVVTMVVAPIWLDIPVIAIVMLVVAEQLCASIVFLTAMLIQARAGFPAATRVKLVLVVLRFAVVSSLWATGNLTIPNLAAGFCVCFAPYAIYLLLVHLPRHGYAVVFDWPNLVSVRASATFSVPMGVSAFQTNGDKFLLNVFNYKGDAGLYGAAYRMVQLGTLPLLAVDTAAFQRFLPQGQGQRGEHWRRASKMGMVMVGISALAAITFYFMLPYLDFFFRNDYKEAINWVPWLLPLIPLMATNNSPLNGLLGLGLPEKRAMIYIASSVVSLIAYLALIPPFSWKGAVVATFISEVFLSVTAWTSLWYYQRRADRAMPPPEWDPRVMTPV